MVHMDHVAKERKSYNRVVEISREKTEFECLWRTM